VQLRRGTIRLSNKEVYRKATIGELSDEVRISDGGSSVHDEESCLQRALSLDDYRLVSRPRSPLQSRAETSPSAHK
jgi:hypothetical protein